MLKNAWFLAEGIVFAFLALFGIMNPEENNTSVYYDHVSATENAVIQKVEGTNLSYQGELRYLGDYYEITFDVVNPSRNDVMITKNFGLDDNRYFSCSLVYSDGKKVSSGDILKGGETKTLIYRVSYDHTVLESDYSTDAGFTLQYEQVL